MLGTCINAQKQLSCGISSISHLGVIVVIFLLSSSPTVWVQVGSIQCFFSTIRSRFDTTVRIRTRYSYMLLFNVIATYEFFQSGQYETE